MTLDSMARKEIVDYVYGLGLDIVFRSLRENRRDMLNILKSLRLDDSSWRGRTAKGLYTLLSDAKRDYQTMGLKKNVVDAIMKNKEQVLKNWKEQGYFAGIKGVGFKNWQKIVKFCAKSQSANVDTVVTTDIHRLIRLTGTLHGKTGLKNFRNRGF
jgi:DNA primase small subunit